MMSVSWNSDENQWIWMKWVKCWTVDEFRETIVTTTHVTSQRLLQDSKIFSFFFG
jgi:hypothetical protein